MLNSVTCTPQSCIVLSVRERRIKDSLKAVISIQFEPPWPLQTDRKDRQWVWWGRWKNRGWGGSVVGRESSLSIYLFCVLATTLAVVCERIHTVSLSSIPGSQGMTEAPGVQGCMCLFTRNSFRFWDGFLWLGSNNMTVQHIFFFLSNFSGQFCLFYLVSFFSVNILQPHVHSHIQILHMLPNGKQKKGKLQEDNIENVEIRWTFLLLTNEKLFIRPDLMLFTLYFWD